MGVRTVRRAAALGGLLTAFLAVPGTAAHAQTAGPALKCTGWGGSGSTLVVVRVAQGLAHDPKGVERQLASPG